MKQGWKRILTVALAFVLALSVLPLGSTLADEGTAAAAYGKVTADKVYLRKQPSTDADYWFRMNTNHVAQILDIVSKGGKSWYKVVTHHPDNNGREYTGYIMSDFFTPLTAEEANDWSSGSTLPTATPTVGVSGSTQTTTAAPSTSTGNRLGEITAGGVNFRAAAGLSGGLIMKLEHGIIVELLSIPDTIDSEHWFRVRYAGYEGYIMSTFVRVLEDTAGGLTGGLTAHGYVKLTENTANLRQLPSMSASKLNTWRTKGEVLPFVSTPVQAEGYTWYEVLYSSSRYWVRGDCVQQVDSTGRPATGTPPSLTNPPQTSVDSTGYIITTKNDVNLRLLPFGEEITKIKKNVVLPYSRIVPAHSSGNASDYIWYFVTYTINGSEVSGYIRSDCAQVCNADGSAIGTVTATPNPGVTETNPPATNAPATSAPTATVTYVKTVKTEVAFRKTPGGAVLDRVVIGTVATVTGATRKASKHDWYPVRLADGRTGYFRDDCVVLCDANGNVGGSSGTVTDGSGNAGSTPTVTPTPSTGSYGYVQITMDRTFIRATMDGTKLFRIEKKGGIYQMWGPKNSKNNIVWYPIIVDGTYGWVRGDCAKEVDQSGVTAAPPTTAPTTPPTSSTLTTYVITTLNNVNLRASASKDATAMANVPLGTVMAYNTTTGSGSDLWYRVVYNNKNVWVMGSCVKIMTQAEYDEWLAQHPNQEPSTDVIKGYVKTTVINVNIRKSPNGDQIDRVDQLGTVLPYTETQVVRNITWYYVTTSTGVKGWMNGNYLVETDSSGTPAATPTPTAPTPTTTPSGTYTPSTAGQEASYTTLKLGSSGQAVTNLVTELKLQGYYTGAITSTYTSEVEAAVKAFQKAKGLTVDGIAGSDTQHALFQTVPKGSGSSVDFTFYPVEKVDWFTGTINQDWAKGTNIKIYDVKTSIVWTAHRWSGGNHVDAEPLTAADTARLCKIYGVSTAKEISDKNLYQGRPSLALVGNHNYACSVYGIPHGGDDVIANNNFDGMLCVHFTNSKGHPPNDHVSTNHAEAIEYAYTHAPAGQKK
ncbi:MAG: peptidoglycan-binding protein [Christensenellaceae bacterium]|nr:peptidoglycan-binding protein [Christensenellaceae bacterium]